MQRNICCRWFFCLWDTPGSEGVECALQYHQAETVCHRQSNRTRLIGQEHSCGVQFVVTPAIIDCMYVFEWSMSLSTVSTDMQARYHLTSPLSIMLMAA